MGYYNPIYIYGVERFLADAKAAGVDGLIVVDLPPEEDDGAVPAGAQGRAQFHPPRHADHRRQAAADRAHQHLGLRLLRLDHRHHRLGGAGRRQRLRAAVARIKRHTKLPVASASACAPPSRPRAIARRRRRRRGRLGAGRCGAQEPRTRRQADGRDGAGGHRSRSRACRGRALKPRLTAGWPAIILGVEFQVPDPHISPP